MKYMQYHAIVIMSALLYVSAVQSGINPPQDQSGDDFNHQGGDDVPARPTTPGSVHSQHSQDEPVEILGRRSIRYPSNDDLRDQLPVGLQQMSPSFSTSAPEKLAPIHGLGRRRSSSRSLYQEDNPFGTMRLQRTAQEADQTIGAVDEEINRLLALKKQKEEEKRIAQGALVWKATLKEQEAQQAEYEQQQRALQQQQQQYDPSAWSGHSTYNPYQEQQWSAQQQQQQVRTPVTRTRSSSIVGKLAKGLDKLKIRRSHDKDHKDVDEDDDEL